MKHLEEGDFLKLLRMDPALYQPAAECGLRTFWMMAGVLDAKALKIKKLSYQGPFGVGYGVVSLRVTREDPRRSFAERYEMLEQRAMEAFWQKGQARLQPKLPTERMKLPG